MLISTFATPLGESDVVPQMSPAVAVEQPAAYVVLLRRAPVAGNVVPIAGPVASTVQVRLVVVPALPARSTARTSKVCEPSASAP